MSLDVTIIYKKPKMVKYNATHAACGSTFMIVPDDVPHRGDRVECKHHAQHE